MRSRLLLLGLVPVVLGACGGESTPASAPPKPTPAAEQTRYKALTIQLRSVVTTKRAHVRSPNVMTVGDRIEFEDDLVNIEPRFGKGANEKVGTDKGTMTFTSQATAVMKGVARLPDGTIVFEGEVTPLPNDRVSVPITGGTGTYKNAWGTLIARSGTRQSRNTYRLRVEGSSGPIA